MWTINRRIEKMELLNHRPSFDQSLSHQPSFGDKPFCRQPSSSFGRSMTRQSSFAGPLNHQSSFAGPLNHQSSFRRTGGSSTQSRVQPFHSATQWRTHFNNLKQSSQLMVIDFTATWCGPCKFIEPLFAELSATHTDVNFVKIDVDELKMVAQEFEIDAMPTLVLIKQGKEVDRIVGARKDELEKKIKMHKI